MQCINILNLDHKPKEYNKLFFGDYGNFGRLDKINYEVFKNLAEASEANTWFMNEISYAKDKDSWDNLSDKAKRMFKLNILYQMAMDALVPDIFSILSNFVTDTWLSYVYSRISTEEKIHNLSYSSGLTQVFGSEATNIIDSIYTDDMIKRRTDDERKIAEKFISKVYETYIQDDEAKKIILELLFRTYLLEGVKFPFSFFTTWIINKVYNNSIQGFSQALKLIAWDEMTFHTVAGKNLINILRRDKEQGFSHLFDSWFNEEAVKIAKETANLEIEWAKYLLKDGEIPEFNLKIATHFIKYYTDKRLKDIKLSVLYNEKSSDIINWYDEYRNLNNNHVALQEAETTNYQKGKLKNDLDSYQWTIIE